MPRDRLAIAVVDGTDRPATGRVAGQRPGGACEERRIGDCKIGAGHITGNHAVVQSRLAAHGARRCVQQAGYPGGRGTGGKCAAEPLGPQVSLAKSRRADGSRRIAKCNAKGKECATTRSYISRRNTKYWKMFTGLPGPGRLRGAAGDSGMVAGRAVLLAHSGLRPPTEERIRSLSVRSRPVIGVIFARSFFFVQGNQRHLKCLCR